MSFAQPSRAPTPSPEGPAWVGETIALAREEARRFATTALRFISRPGRFSAEWFDGRQRVLNPLGFVATALGITGAIGVLIPGDDNNTIIGSISAALMPYVYYVAVGVASHPLLRLAGSKRRLSASIAVALFAGGGPGLVVTLLFYLTFALRIALFGKFKQSLLIGLPPWAQASFALLVYGPFLYYFTVLTLALAGLHAVGRLRAVAAVLCGLVVTGFALGALHQTTQLAVGVPHFAIAIYNHMPVPDIWF